MYSYVNGMKLKPVVVMIAGLFAATGYVATASATGLPQNVVDIAKQLNISVESDGSFTFNGTKYVTLIPPGYSASQSATGQPAAQSDGSIVWGNLQFAPLVQTPGELPHLPDNLQPLSGNTLPSDFNPPAGFVPSSSVPLPAGVTVPPLSASAMLKQMEDAGMLPAGLVKFNSDGTVSVNGGSSYLPFLPPTDQQGKAKDPSIRSLKVGADGSVTFPDGSTFAPLVSGKNAGGTTLPSGFTPPAGTSLPSGVNLPQQFEIPSTLQIPSGMTLPVGVVIPENYSIPTGTTLPPGVSIPSSATLGAGVTVSKGITLPAGTQLSSGAALPQGTTVLPNGQVVIPGDKIPTGVTPPSNWTPPAGATKGSDGSYSLPTPPANGFAPPPMPLSINADGSVVIQGPNGETITVPPPSFIGSIGSGGTVEGPGFGVTMPTGFTPQIPTGTALPGAGSIPSGCMVPPTGTQPPGMFTADPLPPPPGGSMPPPGGTTTMPPPGSTPLGGITC